MSIYRHYCGDEAVCERAAPEDDQDGESYLVDSYATWDEFAGVAW